MADHRDDSSLRRDPGTIALVCAQGICAATVVVGLKALPGSDLIGHPVATIQSALAVTLPAVIVTYTAMTRFTSSPRPIWRTVGDGLLCLPVGAVIFALLALSFGAPTSLQNGLSVAHSVQQEVIFWD